MTSPRRSGRPAGRARGSAIASVLASVPAGCSPSSGAPAIPFLGAFFRSWLLSALAGVIIAIAVRVVFIRIGLDDALPARLAVYLAVAVIAGLFVSDLVFGR